MQALRAIAVLMVLVFHLWPAALPGGYAGVDVFFVISGFLITAHLLRELEATGTIRLRRFWARRIVRLLPAAMLVLAATLLASWLWLPVTRWQQLAAEVAASALQVENWWLTMQATDYFAASQAASPVQHYWSLSVEEQFYLAWPLLLLAAAARARSSLHGVMAMLALLAGASLAWSLYQTAASPATAYFSTLARAWEFAAGGLLAVWRHTRPVGDDRHDARALLGWTGLAGLAATAWLYDGTTPFPGIAALLPVASTLAIIAAGAPAGRLSAMPLLRLRALQWLGHVAYPVYLWHWPLIVLVPLAIGTAPHDGILAAVAAATLLLAWLTSVSIEHRFRLRADVDMRPWATYAKAAAATVALLLASALLWRAGAAPGRPSASASASAATGTVPDARGPARRDCRGAAAMRAGSDCPQRFRTVSQDAILAAQLDGGGRWLRDRASEVPWLRRECRIVAEKTMTCRFPAAARPTLRLVLAGDSHLLQHLPAIAELAHANRWSVDYYMGLGCPVAEPTPTSAGEVAPEAHCHAWRASMPADIAGRDDIDLVLTAGSTRRFGRDLPAAAQQVLADAYVATWTRWTRTGKNVLVIADNPLSATADGRAIAVPDCVATAREMDDPCALPRALALPSDPVDLALRRAPRGVTALDLSWAFCDATTCHFTIGGLLTHMDADHVTATYNLTLLPELGDAILRAAGRDPATLVLPGRPAPATAAADGS